MKKLILFSLLLNLIVTFNCYCFDLKDHLAGYLKEEFAFDEVYIDSIKTDTEIASLPDKINIEKFYGRLLKISIVYNGDLIDGKAEVRAYKKVFTTKIGLDKGKEITGNDIVESFVEYSKIPKGAILDANSIIGKTLKVSMPANAILTENKLLTIKKGEIVTVKMDSPGFTVKMEGKALEDGNTGKTIRVLNMLSNKIIKGIVQNDKSILVF